MSLIGPSVSGKSTLLRCLNILAEIQSGEIIINGESIYDKKVNTNALRKKFGMVFQSLIYSLI